MGSPPCSIWPVARAPCIASLQLIVPAWRFETAFVLGVILAILAVLSVDLILKLTGFTLVFALVVEVASC